MKVVFLLSDYVLHNHVIGEYLAARPDDEVAVVKVPLVLKGKGRRTSAQRIVPQLSRRFTAGKLLEYLALTGITWTPKMLSRGAVFRRLRQTARRHRLPFLKVDDVMSKRSLEFIRRHEPDVVVSLFHQIIKKRLIAIPRLGVVNVHPGVLPQFRGIQPYFWELSEGSDRAGVTLHLIEDESIDTGGVLAEASYPVRPGMSVQLNYYLTCKAAAELLPRCLAALGEGRLTPRSQSADEGAYWRWPDSAAFDRLQERGHPLVSWRQLGEILTGRHDDFTAEQWSLAEE
ncbi:MAG: formyl transferase [Acidobacteriota bacterium]